MRLRRKQHRLGQVDFVNGAAIIDGEVLPITTLNITMKPLKENPTSLTVIARRKLWPWGRMPKNFLEKNPLDESGEHFAVNPEDDHYSHGIHEGFADHDSA